MAEYIDKELILKKAVEFPGCFSKMVSAYDIAHMTAADVAEVRRGCWEEASDGDGVVCSECGTDFCTMIHETEKFRFCPNCGALMKEADHEVSEP